MKRNDRRSDCPINFALETFGDTWSLLILRDLLFTGKRTYGEFLASEERIATNVLAARLKSLENAGLIRAEGEARNVRYSLTKMGLDLLPTLLEMIAWSAQYDARTAAPPPFVSRIRRDRTRLIRELRTQLMREHELSP
jgi:DNA-binding HxlR family transcriptional regulator